MAIKYTEEQLNSVDKSMLIQMFLNQQEQLEKVSADSFLIIKQIQAIYREEGKLKELSSKERLVQRQVVVKPLVDALFVYLKQHENEVGTEKLREAFIYVLNQEKYLRVFLTDGDVPMDNNASERAIRGFCVGKKNWQMIDTINGAKSSDIIYSIAETAKANNLKPYEYFEYLLTEIPKHMDDTDCIFRKNCASVPEERSAIPLQTEQNSAGRLITIGYSAIPARKFKAICLRCHST